MRNDRSVPAAQPRVNNRSNRRPFLARLAAAGIDVKALDLTARKRTFPATATKKSSSTQRISPRNLRYRHPCNSFDGLL